MVIWNRRVLFCTDRRGEATEAAQRAEERAEHLHLFNQLPKGLENLQIHKTNHFFWGIWPNPESRVKDEREFGFLTE